MKTNRCNQVVNHCSCRFFNFWDQFLWCIFSHVTWSHRNRNLSSDSIFSVKNFYFCYANSLILLSLLCTSWKKNLSNFNSFDKEAICTFLNKSYDGRHEFEINYVFQWFHSKPFIWALFDKQGLLVIPVKRHSLKQV